MADDHAGKRCVPQNGFEPLDAFQVEVVCGLVEQKNIRLLHQSGGDGQPLAPTAGKRISDCIVIFKTGTPEDLRKAPSAFVLRNMRLMKRFFNDRANGFVRLKLRYLCDRTQACAFTQRYVTVIRFDASGENLDQGGFSRTVWTDQADPFALRP